MTGKHPRCRIVLVSPVGNNDNSAEANGVSPYCFSANDVAGTIELESDNGTLLHVGIWLEASWSEAMCGTGCNGWFDTAGNDATNPGIAHDRTMERKDMSEKTKSDLSRAFSEDGKLKTHVGGQALLEGIMMRGKFNWAVAVREPEGIIYTEEHDLASGKDKNGWLYKPFIRGCRAFVESLMLGYKALSIAAEHAFVEEEEADDAAGGQVEKASGEAAPAVEMVIGDSAVELGTLPGDAAGACALPDDGEANGNLSEGARVDGSASNGATESREFSWIRDFGHPDEMIDALGAQRTLEVVVDETFSPGEDASDIASPRKSISTDSLQTDASPVEGTSSFTSPGEDAAAEASQIAHCAEEDVAASSEGESAPAKKPLLGDFEMAISMVLGLGLGVALFIIVPAFVTNLIVGEYDEHTLLWNIVDGILRIGIFIFYIWLIGRMSDIKRMFGYHGAEHKTIHCFEHGLPLTPENARSFPRLHVRCGTAFLIMVMIIAIFIYTITPIDALIAAWGVPDGVPKLALVIVVRILLMPVIAGVAYEITVKWAGSHPDNPLVKVILWPGMQMQYLTTREPDDGQIECAIAAMQLVLEREQRENAA